tara:strand:+ start:225 stop:470 length:246 start_codon:yes stop_codon:yes gene_type:complete
MYGDKECIICLSNTSENDYLKLNCCGKIVHVECLDTWIKTNIEIIDESKKCLYCRQNNDYINMKYSFLQFLEIMKYVKMDE